MANLRRTSKWGGWLEEHEQQLRSQSPYEWQFADKVLQHVNGLTPTMVRLQEHFIDQGGGNRYIDFVIVNDGVRIAIEVDGWDKVGAGHGMTPDQFDDFLNRQRAIVHDGWELLRFSNRFFSNHPDLAIREISLMLQKAGAKATARTAALTSAESEELEQLRNLSNNLDVLRELVAANEARAAAAEAALRAARTQTHRAHRQAGQATVAATDAQLRADQAVRQREAALADVAAAHRRLRLERRVRVALIGALLVISLGTLTYLRIGVEAAPGMVPEADGSCPEDAPIKGNRSMRDSEAIYHLPGGQFYEATTPVRCFAHEDEAVAAGFRRSQR